MSIKKILLGACVASTLSTASAADTIGAVSRVEGTAFISQDSGYSLVHQGVQVKQGDRLMTTEDSSVILDFSDDCRYTMTGNQVLTLGDVSACAAEAVHRVNPDTGVAQNPNAGAAELQLAAVGAPGDDGNRDAIIAGAIVVAFTAAIVASDDDDDDKPSPR